MHGNKVSKASDKDLKEPIQTPKRREKIVTKKAVAESHIYEEIAPFKNKDNKPNSLDDEDTPDKALLDKNHIYDELIKPKEAESSKEGEKEQKGILGRIRNIVFRAYTKVTPWWVARRVYWKKERVGDEEFTTISRRNSKSKIRAKTKSPDVLE